MPPIEIEPDRLFSKIGQLVIENEVLREQLAAAVEQVAQPESNDTTRSNLTRGATTR